jgi:hypothetical protein
VEGILPERKKEKGRMKKKPVEVQGLLGFVSSFFIFNSSFVL